MSNGTPPRTLVPVASFSREGITHLLTIEPGERGPRAVGCSCEAGERGHVCIHVAYYNDPEFRKLVAWLWSRYRAGLPIRPSDRWTKKKFQKATTSQMEAVLKTHRDHRLEHVAKQEHTIEDLYCHTCQRFV